MSCHQAEGLVQARTQVAQEKSTEEYIIEIALLVHFWFVILNIHLTHLIHFCCMRISVMAQSYRLSANYANMKG